MLLRTPLNNIQKRAGYPGRLPTTRAIRPDLDQFPGSISTRDIEYSKARSLISFYKKF